MGRTSKNNSNISINDVDIASIVDSAKDTASLQQDLAKETAKVQQDLAEETSSYTKETAKVQQDLAEETSSYTKEVAEAGWEGIKDSSKQAMSTISGHSREVLGSGLTEVYDLSKSMAASLGGGLKKMWDVRQERKKDKSEEFLEDISNSQDEFTSAALSKGSIYTHDITMEGMIGDVSQILETQEQTFSNMEEIVDKGQLMQADSNRIMTKALDMLYDRGGEEPEEEDGIDILEIVANILNTLSGQADDIQLMRISQVEQMGFVTKFVQPMKEFYSRSLRNVAKGNELVENRLVEIRRILSKALNVSESSVAVADKSWKFLPKVLLSPLLLPLWGIKTGIGLLSTTFGKGDKDDKILLSEDEKRNNLLFDILKGVRVLKDSEIDNKKVIEMIRAPKGGIEIEGKQYKGGQFLPKDMTKALVVADKKDKDDEKQTSLLVGIKGYFLDKQKADQRETDPKKGGWWGILIGAAVLLAGILLGYGEQIKNAFKGIINIFKTIKTTLQASFLNVVDKFFGKESKIGKILTKIFGPKGYIVEKLGKPFTKIMEFISKSKKLTFLFNFGKVIGKILLPFEMIYKAIKGFISAKSIRDKLLGLSAGLLDPILKIPELIGNGLLWLARKVFGEDFLKGFSFDFSASVIIDVINGITDWIFNNVTVPILDFFGLGPKPTEMKKLQEGPGLVDNIIGWYKTLINDINNWVYENVPGAKWLQTSIDSLLGRSDGEPSIISRMIGWYKTLINDINNWVYENVPGAKWLQTSIDSLLGRSDGEPSIISRMIGWYKTLKSNIDNWLGENIPGVRWLTTSINDLFGSSDGEPNFIDNIINFIKSLPTMLSDYLKTSKLGKGISWITKKLGIGEKGETTPDTSKTLKKPSLPIDKQLRIQQQGQQSITDKQQRVQELQDEVKRSKAGEDVFWGREGKGQERNLAEIEKLNAQIEEEKASLKVTESAITLLAQEATKEGSLYVKVVNWDDITGSKSVKKVDGKIESAEADKLKAAQDLLAEKKNTDQLKLEAQQGITRAIKDSSIKSDKSMGQVSNNVLLASSSGGGNSNIQDIPEEVDNYLLGLAVAGVLN